MPLPSSRATRLALFAALGLLAVAALWTAAWFWAASAVRGSLEEWAADRRSKGWTVSYGDLHLGGYPFALEAVMENPMLIDPTGMGWLGPKHLHARTTPWAPRTIAITAPGSHVLTMNARGENAASLPIEAPSANGTVTLNADGSARRVEVVLTDADVARAKVGAAKLILDGFGVREADHSQPTLHVGFEADRVQLPGEASPVLGRDLSNLSIDATVQGGLPSDSLAVALTEWRDDGGTVEVRRAATHWGPLNLEGEGTLALDQKLQPLLGAAARVAGFNETVERFEKAGLLPADAANMARLVLGLLAKPATPGGPPVITLPLTIQNGRLFAGPVEMMKVPAIPWPGLDKSGVPEAEPPVAAPAPAQ